MDQNCIEILSFVWLLKYFFINIYILYLYFNIPQITLNNKRSIKDIYIFNLALNQHNDYNAQRLYFALVQKKKKKYTLYKYVDSMFI